MAEQPAFKPGDKVKCKVSFRSCHDNRSQQKGDIFTVKLCGPDTVWFKEIEGAWTTTRFVLAQPKLLTEMTVDEISDLVLRQ